MKTNPQLEDLKLSLLAQIQSVSKEKSGSFLEEASQLQFPNAKNEEWKYSPFKVSKEAGYTLRTGEGKAIASIPAEAFEDCHLLVFLDGAFIESISSREEIRGLEISRINQFEPFTKSYENNIFNQLNSSTAHISGLSIQVSEKTVIEKPIVIFHCNSNTESAAWVQPRIQVKVGERAEVTFAEVWQSDGAQPVVTNAVLEIDVKKSAIVKWFSLEKGNKVSSLINQTRVETAEKAIFQHIVVSLGEGFVRNNLEIKINGTEADAHMYGLSIGSAKLHVDHHTFINHKAVNTTSNQLYKSIFSGKATGVFNGKILVDQIAQKTNAYQSSKNILLSSDAKVYAKPQLEIFADDVKCSHGATIGQLDEEPIFYLRSRGLDEATARQMLVQAFASEILMKVDNKSLHAMFELEIMAEMERLVSK
jgi:Fe-S cluster assembly protein SufD